MLGLGPGKSTGVGCLQPAELEALTLPSSESPGEATTQPLGDPTEGLDCSRRRIAIAGLGCLFPSSCHEVLGLMIEKLLFACDLDFLH